MSQRAAPDARAVSEYCASARGRCLARASSAGSLARAGREVRYARTPCAPRAIACRHQDALGASPAITARDAPRAADDLTRAESELARQV